MNKLNITFSVEQAVAEQARKAAQAMGKSLNQVVREYLLQLAGSESLEADLAELRATSGQGNSRGWKFNRDETYASRLEK